MHLSFQRVSSWLMDYFSLVHILFYPYLLFPSMYFLYYSLSNILRKFSSSYEVQSSAFFFSRIDPFKAVHVSVRLALVTFHKFISFAKNSQLNVFQFL